MNFIRLFKITGHFGTEFIFSDPDINRKSEFVFDSIFYFMGNSDRSFKITYYPGHIEKTLINRKFFYSWRVKFTYIFKFFRVKLIQFKIGPTYF